MPNSEQIAVVVDNRDLAKYSEMLSEKYDGIVLVYGEYIHPEGEWDGFNPMDIIYISCFVAVILLILLFIFIYRKRKRRTISPDSENVIHNSIP